MKERPFREIIRKKYQKFSKKAKMRIFNSLIVPKNVKEGPLDFLNIHSVAKPKKEKGGPFEEFKKFRKKSHKVKKRGESLIATETWKGDPSGFCFSR